MIQTMKLIYKGMAAVLLLFSLGLVLNSCAADSGSSSDAATTLEKPPSPEDVFTF